MVLCRLGSASLLIFAVSIFSISPARGSCITTVTQELERSVQDSPADRDLSIADIASLNESELRSEAHHSALDVYHSILGKLEITKQPAAEPSLVGLNPVELDAVLNRLPTDDEKLVVLRSIAERLGVQPEDIVDDELRATPTRALLLARIRKKISKRLNIAIAATTSLRAVVGHEADEDIEAFLSKFLALDLPKTDILGVLTSAIRQTQPIATTSSDYLKHLWSVFEAHVPPPHPFQATPISRDLFVKTASTTWKTDLNTVHEMVSDSERASQSGHTLSTHDYILRHLDLPLMKYLVDHPEMGIRIFQGATADALRNLQERGFTQILRFPKKYSSDFDFYLAENPKTSQKLAVTVGRTGSTMAKEMAAHFLYFKNEGKGIAPARVKILSDVRSPLEEFTDILQENDLKPDLLLIGDTDDLRKSLAKRGITPQQRIQDENLSANVYQINGKTVLSVTIEPYLAGDRCGQLLRAILARNQKAVSVFVGGTTGSLKRDLVMGDGMVPNAVFDANALEPKPLPPFVNHAKELVLPDEVYPRGSMRIGGNLASVDTIFSEDHAWLQSMANPAHPIDLVEQEAAGLVSAVSDYGHAKLYAVYRVLDEPANGEDFNRVDTRNITSQTTLRDRFLHLNLGEHWVEDGTEHPAALTVAERKAPRGDLVFDVFTDPENVLARIDCKQCGTLRTIDSKAVSVLQDWIVQAVAKKAANLSEELSDIQSRFAKKYQYSIELSPVTSGN